MPTPKLTPMLEQFLHIKNQHPDKIVLFRMGDFYETFFDDAQTCAKILNITLTARNKKKENAVPLAGFPYHSLSSYLPRLIAANQKVVICEQVEDPKKAVGLVKREIVEIITPGSIVESEYIHSPADNFLTSLVQEGSEYGVARFSLIAQEVALEKKIATGNFDLIITGEGRIDSQTANGKLPLGVAKLGKKHGVPVIAVVGSVGEGLDLLYESGLVAVYSLIRNCGSLAEILETSEEDLQFVLKNIFRTVLAFS